MMARCFSPPPRWARRSAAIFHPRFFRLASSTFLFVFCAAERRFCSSGCATSKVFLQHAAHAAAPVAVLLAPSRLRPHPSSAARTRARGGANVAVWRVRWPFGGPPLEFLFGPSEPLSFHHRIL